MGEDRAESGRGTVRPECPTIECGRCGAEWHYDCAGEPCPDCSAFLREATDEEHHQFGEFLEWNTDALEEGDA